MKKNITITILLIITSISIIYGLVKGSEAKREKVAAEIAQEEAEKIRDEAMNLQKIAMEEAANARKAEAESVMQKELTDRAILELQECQSK